MVSNLIRFFIAGLAFQGDRRSKFGGKKGSHFWVPIHTAADIFMKILQKRASASFRSRWVRALSAEKRTKMITLRTKVTSTRYSGNDEKLTPKNRTHYGSCDDGVFPTCGAQISFKRMYGGVWKWKNRSWTRKLREERLKIRRVFAHPYFPCQKSLFLLISREELIDIQVSR